MPWNAVLGPERICTQRPGSNEHTGVHGTYLQGRLLVLIPFLANHNIHSLQIADFGMSRDLADEDYYESHGGKVPVKWTAPEALRFNKYSTASEVWSYGCVLYEIWSLGHTPFDKC